MSEKMKIFAISSQMAQNDPKNYAASGTQSGQSYCPEMEEKKCPRG